MFQNQVICRHRKEPSVLVYVFMFMCVQTYFTVRLGILICHLILYLACSHPTLKRKVNVSLSSSNCPEVRMFKHRLTLNSRDRSTFLNLEKVGIKGVIHYAKFILLFNYLLLFCMCECFACLYAYMNHSCASCLGVQKKNCCILWIKLQTVVNSHVGN